MSYVTPLEKVPSLLLAIRGLNQLAGYLSLGSIGTAPDGCLVVAHGERAFSVEVAGLACGHERTPLQLGSRALRPSRLLVGLRRFGKVPLTA